jgi:hypothetical protein
MSAAARKEIARSIDLIEAYVPQPALWTVTLPDSDYERIRELGTWQRFQNAVRDAVARLLRAAGEADLVLCVVELGTERTLRTGRPMPHIHVVCSGWGVRADDGGWLLRPAVMDGLVEQACLAAGLSSGGRPACSRLEPIRKSVRSYLSAYLKKGSDMSNAKIDAGWDELIPRQWWNRSQALKALRDGHVWRLPSSFAAFVIQQRRRLEGLGLGLGRLVTVGRRQSKTVDLPIEVLCFQWASVDAFQQGLEWFAAWGHSPPAFEAEADRCLLLASDSWQAADIGLSLPQ